MNKGEMVSIIRALRKADTVIPCRKYRNIWVWFDRNGNVKNLHLLPRNNFHLRAMNELSSHIDIVDKIRCRVYEKDGVVYGAVYEPSPSGEFVKN